MLSGLTPKVLSSKDNNAPSAHFGLRDKGFEGAASYSDWKFVYVPASVQKPAQEQSQQPGAPLPQVPLQPLQQPGALSPR